MGLEKIVVGLTGNIASGKSTAAQTFKDLGAYVIDADKVGHEVYKKSLCLKYNLVRNFGFSILDKKSLDVDRKKLGSIVFNDYNKLEKLSKIVWPYIDKSVWKKVKKNDGGIVVVEAAVLFEAGWEKKFDYAIMVVADYRLRLERLMKKGLSYSDCVKRLNAQMSQDVKVGKADYVIDNSSDLKNLQKEVERVWQSLKGNLKVSA